MNRGFTIIEILIAVGVVILIVVGGYFYFTRGEAEEVGIEKADTVELSKTESETANGLQQQESGISLATYDDVVNGFSFQYPASWTPREELGLTFWDANDNIKLGVRAPIPESGLEPLEVVKEETVVTPSGVELQKTTYVLRENRNLGSIFLRWNLDDFFNSGQIVATYSNDPGGERTKEEAEDVIKIIVDSFKLDPNVKKEASSFINVEATKARETNGVYAAFSVDRGYGKAPLFNGVRLTYTDYAAVDDVTKQFCYSDIAYEISWGDSATDISEPSTRCSKTSSFTASEFHTYNIAGTYTISVTATDTRSGEIVIEGEQEVIVRPE